MRTGLCFFLCLFIAAQLNARSYSVVSPDGTLSFCLEGECFSVTKNGDTIIEPSKFALTLGDGSCWSGLGKVRRASKRNKDISLTPIIYIKDSVQDKYNELLLSYRDYSIVMRAYDDAVAWRVIANRKSDFTVLSEIIDLSLPIGTIAHVPYVRTEGSFEQQFNNSFENQYVHIDLRDWDAKRLAFLPITFECKGKCVCVTESDLRDYPGLYFANVNCDNTLEAVHAAYPSEVIQGGYNNIQGVVTGRESFIAKCSSTQNLPWRIIAVSDSPKRLIGSDIVYKLAGKQHEERDWRWVKPGKVAWDWWNDWNIKGVPFKAGINTDTYKFYIDFASAHGVEYVILDEGWSSIGTADLYDIVPEIDLVELIRYAENKNVGLILWAGYWAFNKDPERLCKHYSEMGIKGFKIDFMDRDDQPMVEFYRNAAEVAARYHLVIDFHGAFKPTGLQKEYPNVLNYEGVFGEEMQKFLDISWDQMDNDCTIPFTRMVAGSLDYTPGAMRNSTRQSFVPIASQPMSQGTRCHQLALYPIFFAPLLMLCDSPTNYMAELECFEFISDIPTCWDETIGLDGRIGDYAVVARRKGETWYVGAITDWESRDIVIDSGFLPEGRYSITAWSDGINADRNAEDYAKTVSTFVSGEKFNIHMAPGGGWAARISRIN